MHPRMRYWRTWLLLVSATMVTCLCAVLPCRATTSEPPVDQAAIDRYMENRLSADKYPSLSVGIVHDQDLIFAKAYGTADRKTNRSATVQTIYRIGSVTKVFTTTLMCTLRDKGVVRLDDPIGKYLPPDVRVPTDPRGAPAITLRHLATHSSGLPRVPVNPTPKGDDPYGGYGVQQLYEGLGKTQLIFPTGRDSVYSNLGAGLLGHILERAAGEPYETLLKKNLFDPLGMKCTAIHLSPKQQALYAPGYQGDDTARPAAEWDLGSIAGCGALASNTPDLARFLALQMREGEVNVNPICGGTLTEMHTLQRLSGDSWQQGVGLGWVITHDPLCGDMVWHNGAIAGHTAYIGFVPGQKVGVIVLTNCGKTVDEIGFWLLRTAMETVSGSGSQADLPKAEAVLARHLEAAGGAKAYESIRTMVVRAKGSISGIPVNIDSLLAVPNRYYQKMDMGPLGSVEEGADGRTVWQIQGGQAQIVTGSMRDLALRRIDLAEDTHWRDVYSKAECMGVASFEGRRCYKVALTARTGSSETRYYDAKDGLLAGREYVAESPASEDATILEIYSEYRKYGQILMPARSVIRAGGQDMVTDMQSIEQNVDIPASRFDLPPAVQKLLPKKVEHAPAATRPNARQLEIVRARYGAQGKWVDVTKQARASVKNGQLRVYANNGLAGDPATASRKCSRWSTRWMANPAPGVLWRASNCNCRGMRSDDRTDGPLHGRLCYTTRSQ